MNLMIERAFMIALLLSVSGFVFWCDIPAL